jgi:hypothetical protein
VADHEHRRAAIRSGLADVLGRRTRRQSLVDRRLAETERDRRLAGAEQRARHDCVGNEPRVAKSASERAGLGASCRSERAKLVGAAGGGLRVPDDQKAHRRPG